ncbi:membrane-spanning 4-domains subfamily A member 6A [Echinops telfairi]|uniref:Membrane-spanning 4-domains subfamily A member 6A n=2 Tax=Echinops telfairi TaxID=9371 RepID=A0ABM0J594_ECHTE|nr:membrane-spanning 4-domains subfamily A member 6A [Echinops telfairi]XP_045153017.1 membrane-spanning 4-domains subfamily A member 6A [Echinops telfairi]
MMSKDMPNENIVVLTQSGIHLPQTEKPIPPNTGQDNLMKHVKAEIKVIGTIQILCGLMLLSLGLLLAFSSFSPQFTPAFSTLLKSGYPFIGAFWFVISGSLSIATERKSSKTLVKGSLITNILSCISAVVGFILLCINLDGLDQATLKCNLDKEAVPTRHFYYGSDHGEECPMISASLTGLLILMLVFTVLEFSLGALATVLWWKQTRSDFSGGVLFLPRSAKKNSNVVNSGYEELLRP